LIVIYWKDISRNGRLLAVNNQHHTFLPERCESALSCCSVKIGKRNPRTLSSITQYWTVDFQRIPGLVLPPDEAR
jgi:hypothetical protein